MSVECRRRRQSIAARYHHSSGFCTRVFTEKLKNKKKKTIRGETITTRVICDVIVTQYTCVLRRLCVWCVDRAATVP